MPNKIAGRNGIFSLPLGMAICKTRTQDPDPGPEDPCKTRTLVKFYGGSGKLNF